jgi:hypothetical protein
MSRVSKGLAADPGAVAAIADLGALLTVAYTTDAPSITPDGTYTIADGDATVSATERNELAEECESAFATVRTKLNLVLAALRDAGIILP